MVVDAMILSSVREMVWIMSRLLVNSCGFIDSPSLSFDIQRLNTPEELGKDTCKCNFCTPVFVGESGLTFAV